MRRRDLKVCVIGNSEDGMADGVPEGFVGYRQWQFAFNADGPCLEEYLESRELPEYDIIIMRLSGKTLSRIPAVAAGKTAGTRLVIICDIPLCLHEKHFKDPVQVKQATACADLLAATEYSICRGLSQISGRRVYEIPHPADLEGIKSWGTVAPEKNIMAVLYNTQRQRQSWILKVASRCGLTPVFIHSAGTVESPAGIEAVHCDDRENFFRVISSSKMVLALPDFRNYGKLIIYAAVMGRFVTGWGLLDAMRRCYPFTCSLSSGARKYIGYYYWLQQEPDSREFVLESATTRVAYYSRENLKNRLLEILFEETKQENLKPRGNKVSVYTNYYHSIRKLKGPEQVAARNFVVVSLEKNGSAHIPAFLNYYRGLGADHFYIIDNGSVDNSLELLHRYPDVTIYTTDLPHKFYECEIRRHVLERNCRYKWCVYADIDEFFDFPFAEKLGMKGLIRYMEANAYTSMVAYMLDMFSRDGMEAPSSATAAKEFASVYCYYDTSAVKKENYYKFSDILCNYNTLTGRGVRGCYGGVRNRFFKDEKNKYLLIKHPLLFIDEKIEAVTSPHFSNKTRVADITAVLKHYKYIKTFRLKVEQSVACDSDYDFFTKKEYKTYNQVLNEKGGLNLYTPGARRLDNVNQLLESGFLKVSHRFRRFVRNYEKATERG